MQETSVNRRDALKIAAASLAASPVLGRAARGGMASKTFDVVFEGGGIKGAAFVGAFQAFEEAGLSYRRLIGSSAGAIVATLLAAGYKPSRLFEILTEHTPEGHHLFSTFLVPPENIPAPLDENGKPAGFIVEKAWKALAGGLRSSIKGLEKLKVLDPLAKKNPNFSPENLQNYVGRGLSLISTGAASSDEKFLDWMGTRLKEAKCDPDIRLAEFHEITSTRGIQASLIATDLTARRCLVLNHRTAPRLPVKWAVRMSMGIPLVWNEVEWREEWGTYRGKPMRDGGEGNRIVDGGVLSNFPLRYLESLHAEPSGVLGPFRDDSGARSLGLMLDETKEAEGSPVAAGGAPSVKEKRSMAERLPAYQSLSRLVDTMSGAWDQESIEKKKEIICSIGVKGFDTLDFDMDKGRLDMLVTSGREAARRYLKTVKGA